MELAKVNLEMRLENSLNIFDFIPGWLKVVIIVVIWFFVCDVIWNWMFGKNGWFSSKSTPLGQRTAVPRDPLFADWVGDKDELFDRLFSAPATGAAEPREGSAEQPNEKPTRPKPPPNPVPADVQALVAQLKEQAQKVEKALDQQTLLTICQTIPRFYQRRQELGGSNAYEATVAEKLKSLVAAMHVYLHIQADPSSYTFESPDDALYLDKTTSEQWLNKASRAIRGYLDVLQAAMRDDSKSEVAAFDLELDNLVPPSSRRTKPGPYRPSC